jgi:hypothetical protein
VAAEATPAPDEHYPCSNEWRHDLFFPAIRDVGGAFVGVGTDQCYTLAAVQDAEMIWIVDFDEIVPRIHRMYGVFVRASATPDELRGWFAEEREDEAMERIVLDLGGDGCVERSDGSACSAAEARRVAREYRRNRGRFAQYLAHVAILRRDGAPTSWLSDPALYARVRALFLANRVVARTGDVTGEVTLRGVGAAAERLGIPVRVLYLSNAERFFGYTPGFVANVRALPTDERSMVLRTFRHARAVYPEDDTWHYLSHPMPDFVARLDLGYRRGQQIVSDAIAGGLGPSGGTTIGPSTPRRYARAR